MNTLNPITAIDLKLFKEVYNLTECQLHQSVLSAPIPDGGIFVGLPLRTRIMYIMCFAASL